MGLGIDALDNRGKVSLARAGHVGQQRHDSGLVAGGGASLTALTGAEGSLAIITRMLSGSSAMKVARILRRIFPYFSFL